MIFRGWSIPIFQGLSRSPCRVTAAVISPVFYSLRYHKPRISAPKAVPPADNFLQKQQKQRDLSPRSGPLSARPLVGGDHVTADVVEIAAARTAASTNVVVPLSRATSAATMPSEVLPHIDTGCGDRSVWAPRGAHAHRLPRHRRQENQNQPRAHLAAANETSTVSSRPLTGSMIRPPFRIRSVTIVPALGQWGTWYNRRGHKPMMPITIR